MLNFIEKYEHDDPHYKSCHSAAQITGEQGFRQNLFFFVSVSQSLSSFFAVFQNVSELVVIQVTIFVNWSIT